MTDAQATDDSVHLSTLQAIQTPQQDQLNVLEILGKLIHGMEALDQRLWRAREPIARDGASEQPAYSERDKHGCVRLALDRVTHCALK